MSELAIVIVFDSAAAALSAEEALAAAGRRVAVMGRPAELGGDCGFCLRVAEGDLDFSLAALAAAGLESQGLWRDRRPEIPRWVRLSPEDLAEGR